MTGEDVPRSAALLSRLLLFGDATTRRRLAHDVSSGDTVLADLLAQTARADDNDDLRVACIEVLGQALEDADHDLQVGVLASLFGSRRI
jgi:hypothetical protein